MVRFLAGWGAGYAALFLFLLTASCGSQNQAAGDETYYLEILAVEPATQEELALARYLKEEIPGFKYGITHSSAREWPYFRQVNMDQVTSPDSLIPPHTAFHVLKPLDTSESNTPGQRMVRVRLFPWEKDQVPYEVEVLMADSSGWQPTGNSGRHSESTHRFKDRHALFGHIRKSVIRYSFK